jgi:tetratricopeptide (TPR) repeat protein
MVRALVSVLVLLLSSPVCFAQSTEDVSRARTHFEAGRALYNLGNYNDAVREFAAGYQLVPRPQFLVNLGQAYRKLGDLEKARDMYRRFLDSAPANDPDREQVKQIVADLDQQLAAQPPPAPPPVAAPVPSPQEAAALTTQASPSEHQPFLKRHWWIFPAGAVVLAGVAVGIYFGVRPAPQVGCGDASLGCVTP